MPTPQELQAALDALIAQATKNEDTEDSATIVINGIPALIDAAVAKVLADNPAITTAQLQSITDVGVALKAHADPLAAAVVANTPAA